MSSLGLEPGWRTETSVLLTFPYPLWVGLGLGVRTTFWDKNVDPGSCLTWPDHGDRFYTCQSTHQNKCTFKRHFLKV